jgi:lipopolysaccharide transport system ATP-binding protein
MYVKLAFSVAAHLDSEIMIMDEVLAVGDMAFQKKCLDKMRDAAKKQGRTVLYVSHNMNTIRQLCDRCVVLDKGMVVFEGDVEQAILHYMGNKSSSSNTVDLQNIPRSTTFQNHDVTMTRIEAVGNTNLLYPVGSKMSISLDLASNRYIRQAHFRIMIRTAEGASVTMAASEKPICLESGTTEQIHLELDISRVVPGKYSLNIVVFEVNEFGGSTNLDGLSDILYFDIVTVPGFNNNMEWLPRYWGHMYSEQLQVSKKPS